MSKHRRQRDNPELIALNGIHSSGCDPNSVSCHAGSMGACKPVWRKGDVPGRTRADRPEDRGQLLLSQAQEQPCLDASIWGTKICSRGTR